MFSSSISYPTSKSGHVGNGNTVIHLLNRASFIVSNGARVLMGEKILNLNSKLDNNPISKKNTPES